MKVIIAIVFIVLWSSSIYIYLDSGLGFNYKETWGDIEDQSILNTKTGSVAIKPAIIDYYLDSGYAFGYRLQTKEMVCKDGKYPRIMMELDPIYFTLNIETGKVREFDDVSLFLNI